MSDTPQDRFVSLAMKVAAGVSTAEEESELAAMIAEDPARQKEFERIKADSDFASAVLPLIYVQSVDEHPLPDVYRERFHREVARNFGPPKLNDQPPPPPEDPPAQGNHRRSPQATSPVLEAEIVPPKPINGYKFAFYALFLLILVVGSVVLFQTCGVPKLSPGTGAGTPVSAAAGNRDPNTSSQTDLTPALPTPTLPPPPTVAAPGIRSQAVPPSTPSPTPTVNSKLKNYRESQWKKLTDHNAVPGSLLFYRSFVGQNQSSPLIEGLLGPNRGVPTKFMLFTRKGNSWTAMSFPNVDSNSQRVLALDGSRILITSHALNREVSLIENGQSRDIILPAEINCLGAHADASGRLYVHAHNGSVFVVSGASVTRLPETDPNSYVQENGNPTGMRRGFVRFVAKADSGDTMGIHYPEPAALGPAALVRFTGEAWELVCSLGRNYPGKAVHFLTRDSMIAASSREFLVVNGGEPRSVNSPAEFEADRSAEWMAVRAASTEDFVAVDSHGTVYRYSRGNFEQAVGAIPSFQGAGTSGFRSVMIAPDGVIYGIHGLNQWSQSTIYQLVPK